MSSFHVENPVYDVKLSTVGPGKMTGTGIIYEPTNMDLIMKLHYLRGLYFFKHDAAEGLTISNIKGPMFDLLNDYNINCGRFERSESGRPFIKCNDCGVRIIEARCKNTIDEWLEMKDYSLNRLLVSNQVLGPELIFSPLIVIQFTWFRCGGISIGLSWAHILGDAFAASDFINMVGQIISNGHLPRNLPKPEPKTQIPKYPSSFDFQPLSMRWVDPVGDYWITASNYEMGTFSFQITASQLNDIETKIDSPSFESLSAIIWHSLAKIRQGSDPRVITVCRNGSNSRRNGYSGNNQILGIVKADFSIVDIDPTELAALIVDQTMNEASQIEQVMERDQGLSDFVVYGANLTFLDLEESELYGLILKGQKPVFANYTIHGIGDEGVVLVLPGANRGRTVTVILPEDQVLQLRTELEKEWFIV